MPSASTRLELPTPRQVAARQFGSAAYQQLLAQRLQNAAGDDPAKLQALANNPAALARLSRSVALEQLKRSMFAGSGVPEAAQGAFMKAANTWVERAGRTRPPAQELEWLASAAGSKTRTTLLREVTAKQIAAGSQRLTEAMKLRLAGQDEAGLKRLLTHQNGQPATAAITLLEDALVGRWTEDFSLSSDAQTRLRALVRQKINGHPPATQRQMLINLDNSPQVRQTLVRQAQGGGSAVPRATPPSRPPQTQSTPVQPVYVQRFVVDPAIPAPEPVKLSTTQNATPPNFKLEYVATQLDRLSFTTAALVRPIAQVPIDIAQEAIKTLANTIHFVSDNSRRALGRPVYDPRTPTIHQAFITFNHIARDKARDFRTLTGQLVRGTLTFTGFTMASVGSLQFLPIVRTAGPITNPMKELSDMVRNPDTYLQKNYFDMAHGILIDGRVREHMAPGAGEARFSLRVPEELYIALLDLQKKRGRATTGQLFVKMPIQGKQELVAIYPPWILEGKFKTSSHGMWAEPGANGVNTLVVGPTDGPHLRFPTRLFWNQSHQIEPRITYRIGFNATTLRPSDPDVRAQSTLLRYSVYVPVIPEIVFFNNTTVRPVTGPPKPLDSFAASVGPVSVYGDIGERWRGLISKPGTGYMRWVGIVEGGIGYNTFKVTFTNPVTQNPITVRNNNYAEFQWYPIDFRVNAVGGTPRGSAGLFTPINFDPAAEITVTGKDVNAWLPWYPTPPDKASTGQTPSDSKQVIGEILPNGQWK